MTVHFNMPLVRSGICAQRPKLAGLHVLVAALIAATMGLHGGLSQAAEKSAPPPATAPVGTPPAGAYKLDKSHASLILRASHLGFSEVVADFRTGV